MKKETALFAVLLVVLLVLSRLVPHPLSFTALGAVALFSGSLWKKNSLSFAIPLLAMSVTDLYFGIYPGIAFNYAAVALSVLVAPQILGSFWSIAGRGLVAAVLFFVISNFGVWAQAGLYPVTGSGLVECYVAAIPFFKNQLLSTWFYSLVLYSTYRLVFSQTGFEGFFKLNYGRQK
jgi:hypothetical protein